MAKRWTEAEDQTLRELARHVYTPAEAAKAMGRTENSCNARATKLGFSFRVPGAVALRNHFASGGVVVRDDVGGSVGIVWRDGRRNGEAFSSQACEAMMAGGRLRLQNGAVATYGLAR